MSEADDLLHDLAVAGEELYRGHAARQKLFEMISTFPHPYDLYLFSMTVFPGSELNKKLIENGLIGRYDVDARAGVDLPRTARHDAPR